jgi:hypothetical protein
MMNNKSGMSFNQRIALLLEKHNHVFKKYTELQKHEPPKETCISQATNARRFHDYRYNRKKHTKEAIINVGIVYSTPGILLWKTGMKLPSQKNIQRTVRRAQNNPK